MGTRDCPLLYCTASLHGVTMQLSAVGMMEKLVCSQVPHLRKSNLVIHAMAPFAKHVESATDIPVAFYAK